MSPKKTTTPASLKRKPAKSLDGRGDGAAWLILKVTNALTTLDQGQVMEVLGNDPKLMSDLPPVLARHGCRLLEASQGRDEYRFLLAKQRPPQPEEASAKRAPRAKTSQN